MFIIVSTPVAVIIIIYAICKWLKRQSYREKEFWWDQQNLRGGQGCKLYAIAKAILLLIAIAGALLIVVSLAYGQVPACTTSPTKNSKSPSSEQPSCYSYN